MDVFLWNKGLGVGIRKHKLSKQMEVLVLLVGFKSMSFHCSKTDIEYVVYQMLTAYLSFMT